MTTATEDYVRSILESMPESGPHPKPTWGAMRSAALSMVPELVVRALEGPRKRWQLVPVCHTLEGSRRPSVFRATADFMVVLQRHEEVLRQQRVVIRELQRQVDGLQQRLLERYPEDGPRAPEDAEMRWIEANACRLRELYPNANIAVLDNVVVAASDDDDEFNRQLDLLDSEKLEHCVTTHTSSLL